MPKKYMSFYIIKRWPNGQLTYLATSQRVLNSTEEQYDAHPELYAANPWRPLDDYSGETRSYRLVGKLRAAEAQRLLPLKLELLRLYTKGRIPKSVEGAAEGVETIDPL